MVDLLLLDVRLVTAAGTPVQVHGLLVATCRTPSLLLRERRCYRAVLGEDERTASD
jgi:hypothetical protein